MIRKGQVVQGKLIEAIESDRWIVSFQGQLLQVKNSTTLKFKAGEKLELVVVGVHPVELKVVSHRATRASKLNLLA